MVGGGGGRRSNQSIDQYQSPLAHTQTHETTYVERTEIRAVSVKCCIVEIGELFSDSVDVCHGFFQLVEGGERVLWGVARGGGEGAD